MRTPLVAAIVVLLGFAAAGCAGHGPPEPTLLNPEDGVRVAIAGRPEAGTILLNSESDVVAKRRIEVSASCPSVETLHMKEARFQDYTLERSLTFWGFLKWLLLEILLLPLVIILDLVGVFTGTPFIATALLLYVHQDEEARPVPEIRIEHDVDVPRDGPTVPIGIATCTVFIEAQATKNGPLRKVSSTGGQVGASGRCIIELRDLPRSVRDDDRWFVLTVHVQAGGVEMHPATLRLTAEDVRSMK